MQKMLITGGSGFLGKKLGLAFKDQYQITLASRNHTQNMWAEEISGCPAYPVDVSCDKEFRELVAWIRPDVIIHAAALKYVALAEQFPELARTINIQGSNNVARAAIDYKVKTVLGISSDKAACPESNVYSNTKWQMERDLCSLDGRNDTNITCLRLGNIVWSTGSVLEKWQYWHHEGLPILVKGKEHRRFMIDVVEAITQVSDALNNLHRLRGKVLARDMQVISIKNLLKVWQQLYPGNWEEQGPRMGDIKDEFLIAPGEWDNHVSINLNGRTFFLIDVMNTGTSAGKNSGYSTANGKIADERRIKELIEWEKEL